jgi:hypothetical protein
MRLPKTMLVPLLLAAAACGHPTRSYEGGDVVQGAKTTVGSAVPAAQRPGYAKAALAAIGDRLEDEAPEEKAVVATLTAQCVGLDKDLVPALEKALVSEDKSERAGALHVIAKGGAGLVQAAKRRDEVDVLADKSGGKGELVTAAREALGR